MKPGTTILPLTSISRPPAVLDDAVAADGDVACDELAADEIEDPPALEDEVSQFEPLCLSDGAGEKGDGVARATVK